MSSQPIAPPPGSPPTQAPRGSGAGRWATILGVLAIVGGLTTAVVLFLSGSAREESAVEDLARAPAGCDTRLEFDRTGTFYVYVETKGTIGDLGGSCPNDDRDYETDDDRPSVRLVLLDEDGDEIDLDRASGKSYDTAGFAGRVVRTFEIDDTGDATLSVRSDDDEVVVAIGGDVTSVAATSYLWAAVAALGGLALGTVLLIIGASRRRRARRDTGPMSPFVAPPVGAPPPVAPPPMPPPPAGPLPPPAGGWQPPTG